MPTERQRQEYLQALGLDIWIPRRKFDQSELDVTEVTITVDSSVPDWELLRSTVAACTGCLLHENRTQTVFGVGDLNADWMIVGEAPGAEEDRCGEPFVDRAGKLLDEMLRAVGLDRSTTFITNILKCRLPNNRDPAGNETEACRGYLERQVELVNPRLILAVGRIAAQSLLHSDSSVGQLRGCLHFLNDGQIPLVVTYHPTYLLRNPSQKRKVWEDLCLAKKVVQESLT